MGQTSNGKVAGFESAPVQPECLVRYVDRRHQCATKLILYYTNTTLWVYLYSIVDYFPGKKITARDGFEARGSRVVIYPLALFVSLY